MSKGTTTMQDAIEALLTTEPITAREIADKSGATIAVVRQIMTTLEHKGKAMGVGERPIRYCAAARSVKVLVRGDYQSQSSTRYFRPGSYTPPSDETVTLPGMGDPVEE
jgi:hypothetical protein